MKPSLAVPPEAPPPAAPTDSADATSSKPKKKFLQKLNPKSWLHKKSKDDKTCTKKKKKKETSVEKKLANMLGGARYLRHRPPCRSIAQLHRREVQLGRLLGEGSFCEVFEVTDFPLNANSNKKKLNSKQLEQQPQSEHSSLEEQSRQHLRATATHHGRPKYAIKQLSVSLLLMPGTDFFSAAADLVVESLYLQRFDHPNILKAYATAPLPSLSALINSDAPSSTQQIYYDSFFFIADRLTATLVQRIDRWKRKGRKHDLWDKSVVARKTDYALQLASALKYLHARRIIFRDCKPHNIGFKDNGEGAYTVQLFDFGFCRELPYHYKRPSTCKTSAPESEAAATEDKPSTTEDNSESRYDNEENILFRMSRVGSPFYMVRTRLSILLSFYPNYHTSLTQLSLLHFQLSGSRSDS
jgi:serine/threonine protein kinase